MKVKSNENIDDFIMDIDALMAEHNIKVDVTLQFGVNSSRVKPCGNLAYRQMTGEYCPTGCGCRLNTDGTILWCSGIYCDWIGRKK